MSHRLFVGAAAALLAGTAQIACAAGSDSLPSGFTFAGDSRLEYLTANGTDVTSLHSTMDLGYRLPTDGALKFGFDLGLRSWASLGKGGSGDNTAIYAEAVLEAGFGALYAGQSRSAAERVITMPSIAGSKEVENIIGSSFMPRLQYEHLFHNESYGLRYEGEISGATVATSMNHIDGYGNVAQLAASYPIGAISLDGAMEYDVPSGKTSVLLGGKASLGPVDAGLYSFRNAFYANQLNSRVFATYHINDQIDTTVQRLWSDGSIATSLDASYTAPSGIYGQLGLLDISTDKETFTNVVAGFKF